MCYWQTHILLGERMAKLPHTPVTIKTRLNTYVEDALRIMEECLKDVSSTPDKRFKMASDYISMYLRMDSEKRKEEDHRETLRQKKLNNLKTEYIVSEFEEQEYSEKSDDTKNRFSSKVVN